MYARTTLLEIDTLRVDLDDAVAEFEAAVMPRLHEQPGFLGLYALTTPDGRAMLISFWETAESADAGAEAGWYPAVLAEYTTMFRSPPGRETYEVRVAVPPVPVGSDN
jgi:heme-degrading monooxygenase HmoA